MDDTGTDSRTTLDEPLGGGARLLPFESFEEAATSVLAHLHGRHGMGLWMVTRTVGEDWVVLHADDHGYEVDGGDVFRWSDSFCSRMVRGEGPRVAPRSDDCDAYRHAEIATQVQIGAYVGGPLVDDDGDLFGTLCAIDPEPQSEALLAAGAEAELFGRLLMSVLAAERRADLERQRAERESVAARTDGLCGVANRRAWDDVLAAEERRCRRYGDPVGVVAVDLDDLKAVNDRHGHAAGDELLQLAATTLAATVRGSDLVARLGGDEFGVLATPVHGDALVELTDRLRGALVAMGVQASFGAALRNPRLGLVEASAEADRGVSRPRRG